MIFITVESLFWPCFVDYLVIYVFYIIDDGVQTSDSENEDPDESKYSTLQLADWLSFKVDAEVCGNLV